MTNLTSMSETASTAISSLRICFYGAGSMAEAIARGMLSKQLLPAEQIAMLNRSNEARLLELHNGYGVQTRLQGQNNEQLLREADIIFLTMKPKDAAVALTELKSIVTSKQLIISVIAGLSISLTQQLLGEQIPVVRAMPNTSSTIGLGATGVSFSDLVSDKQRESALAIFESFGTTTIVDESLQPAITGISGSGPAYFYYFMEAMIQAGEELGLTKDEAQELVVQTALGAAQMVRQTRETPEELRRKVTSPNGTTHQAITSMAENELPAIVIQAIKRCAARQIEMGQDIERSINS